MIASEEVYEKLTGGEGLDPPHGRYLRSSLMGSGRCGVEYPRGR
jgi:hypothetical protein